MKIYISKGSAEGPTEIAAFDNALDVAGISNLNLIYLSSVIPPNSRIILGKPKLRNCFGEKAFVVMSKIIATKINQTVCAGIGWVRYERDKRGLFVEITGNSKEEVEEKINETLEHMRKYRKYRFGKINMVLNEITCEKYPVCALVSAFYDIEKWDNKECNDTKMV
ncbi:MAG: pyruvoyl-dependent arginine decarboxylase [Nanoarchaeota archaeon]